MSATRALVPALLAGAAAGVWWGLPAGAAVRLHGVLSAGAGPDASAVPATWGTRLASAARQRAGRRAGAERERVRSVEACAVLAAELRAGRSAGVALEAAAAVACGPASDALRAAAAAASLGGDVPAALTGSCSDGSAVGAVLRGLAACWAVCAATGSGLAAAVERLGEAERAAADQRRAVQVELAGPRATARMLGVLPVVGLVMAAGLGADPLRFLLTTLPGRLCLVVGVALEVAGLRWTTRLSARAAAV